MGYLHLDRTGQLQLGKATSLHLLLPLLFLTAYLGNYLTLFSISWGIALLHETSHVLVGRALGIRFLGIGLQPFGVCAKLQTPIIKSPYREIIMALSGPLSNFLLAGICKSFYLYYPNELLNYSITAAMAMGLLNLLPCLPLDGGRILRAILTLGSDALSAWQTTVRISRWVSALLLAMAIVLLLTSSFQFSLLLIGIFLLGNLCNEQKSISHQALRELLYHKEKLERDQLNRTRLLSAYQDLPARRLLRRLSYHTYYTVQVLDQNQTPIATLTESQILDALLHQNIRITLGEIAAKPPIKRF